MKAKLITNLIIATLMLFAIAGCLSPQKETAFDLDNTKKEIDEANRDFVNLFNKGESIGLANMFTVDGKSMEPNEPAFIGRSQIQTHYSIVMKAGANKLGLITIGLWGDENILAEEGEFRFMLSLIHI